LQQSKNTPKNAPSPFSRPQPSALPFVLLIAVFSTCVLIGVYFSPPSRLELQARAAREAFGANLAKSLLMPALRAESLAKTPSLEACLAASTLPQGTPKKCFLWNDALGFIPSSGTERVSYRLVCGSHNGSCAHPDIVEFRFHIDMPNPPEGQSLRTLFRGTPNQSANEDTLRIPARLFALAPNETRPWAPERDKGLQRAPRSETSNGASEQPLPLRTPSARRSPPMQLRPKRNPADTTAHGVEAPRGADPDGKPAETLR
jgi:hypothetical protein